MKNTVLIIIFLLAFLTSNAQQKGPIHWLGSTAQNGGGGFQNFFIDTPASTYTIYGPNTAQVGYAPVCNQCPTFDAQTAPYFVYRTYDNQHNLIKKKCVLGPKEFAIQNNYYAYAERTPDGNFIYAGMGNGNYALLCKADSLGTIIWKDSFYLGSNSTGFIEKLSNGHYLFYGIVFRIGGLVTNHYGSPFVEDAFLMEVDTLGNVYFNEVYGGEGADSDLLVKERGNGFYIMGYTNSNSGVYRGNLCKGINQTGTFVTKLDKTANVLCNYRFEFVSNVYDAIVEQNDDLVLFTAGPTLSATSMVNPNKLFQICKMDSNGNQLWWKQYGLDGKSNNSSSYGFGMIKNPVNDGYIIWGLVTNDLNVPLGDVKESVKGRSDSWIAFLDKNGDLEGQLSYGGEFDDYISEILFYPANKTFLLLGGTRSGTHDFTGGHFIPSASAAGEAFLSEITYWPNSTSSVKSSLIQMVTIYPNPAQNELNIVFDSKLSASQKKVEIINIEGKVVQEEKINSGVNKSIIHLTSLSAASYTVRVSQNNETIHEQKIIINQ